MDIYVVKYGDSIERIANELGVDAETLIYDNQLVYPYELAVGQALLVNRYTRNASGSISTGGYAYPFINSWVLKAETLPFLSELYVFSYGFTAQGELLPPAYGEDDWMIAEALRFGTRPVLTLTPFDENGNFNNQLIHSVVNNPDYGKHLISNLLQTMYGKGYQGVDIDFEYILAEDRDAFTAFVWQVAENMRANGFHTSVALAPKTSSDQPGLLYEGKDYRALGEAADHVLLMTYEWGYTYGPPMAVAPIPQVRQVVEYALTQIPSYKINLGIPNYGYDWPLPFVRGETRARTIGNIEAVRIAIANGAVIQFDELSQSPFFFYTALENGSVVYPEEQAFAALVEGTGYSREHEVWFEDVRSLQTKFDLIREYDLRGCGYWQIMQWFRANWLLLAYQFYILK